MVDADQRGETLEGYVVDLLCLREYGTDEALERAQEHTRDCALHGECIESGYGLVADDGRIHLLDKEATPGVLAHLERTDKDAGIRLRVRREPAQGKGMRTTATEEA